MTHKLSKIANYIGAELQGEPDCEISGIAVLEKAQKGELSFFTNAAYYKQLSNCQASAVILHPRHAKDFTGNVLLIKDPFLAYAKAMELFTKTERFIPEIHPTAIIGKDCLLDPEVRVAANVVIGNRVKIARGVIIEAGCVIGNDCEIGAGSKICARVSIGDQVKIGKNSQINSGAVLGSDGFGYAKLPDGEWMKVPQLCGVVIGDGVEIGANTTIDRGTLEDTRIGNGVKIDNQVQIAHNVEIGDNTVIAGCTGIAGSAKIGKNCTIGGACCIGGHLEIADNVMIRAVSAVHTSLTTSGVYASAEGILMSHSEWRRFLVRFKQIPNLFNRCDELDKKIQNIIDNSRND